MISVTFDWLTLTIKAGSVYPVPADAVMLPLRQWGLFVEYEDAPSANRFYKYARRCARTGATVYWGNVSDDAAASLILAGTNCGLVGDDNVSAIITKLQGSSFAASRIDVAVTFVGEEAAKRLFDALPSVLTVVKAKRKVSVWKDNRGYVTCSVGSRSSSYYLRVYDAPKAQYGGDPNSFRVELEMKGDAAAKSFQQLSPEGIKGLAVRKAASMLNPYSPALSSLLLQCCEFGLVQPPVLGRHSGLEPADWYRKQVVPALLKLKRHNFAKFQEVRKLILDAIDIA